MSTYGLQTGSVEIMSAGPITFGPGGILFLADNGAAKIFAVDVSDPGSGDGSDPFDMENVDTAVASFLGCEAPDLLIRTWPCTRRHTMCTSPSSVVAARQGRPCSCGSIGGTVHLRYPLDDVAFSEMTIVDAPAKTTSDWTRHSPRPEGEEFQFGERTIRLLRRPVRTSTVTDMAYTDGFLLVAGLSNEEFSSKLRRVPFPFREEIDDNSLEIFHVSHGKWETAAPIRTFVPYDGGRSILAGYTCTPVVHFPLEGLASGTRTVGRTVAELGAANQPLT